MGYRRLVAHGGQTQAAQPPLRSTAPKMGGGAHPGLVESLPTAEQRLRGTPRKQRSVGPYRHGQPHAQTPPTRLIPFVTHPLSRLMQLESLSDLAEFWNVAPTQIYHYAFRIDKKNAYSTFEVPRRNGRARRIDAPVRTLKFIQRLIHESLSRIYRPHRAVHGFLAERSIVTNAREHVGRQYVLNVDLADFFPSITRKRVHRCLIGEPYRLNRKVANLIAALSTNAYARLPQGSPSSPVIANMVAADLDAALANLCGELRCRYTRYADDITISTVRNEMSPDLARYPNAQGTGQVILGDKLVAVIENNGFRINHLKSRMYSYWTRQTCTGLVVNGEKPSPSRAYIRRLRSLVDHWRKNGWEDAAQVLHEKENRILFDDRERLLNHVRGRIGFVKMVRGQTDDTCRRLEQVIDTLPENY